MDNLKQLVEHMAKSLVDKPENVNVDEIPGQQTTLLALKVDKEDLGKVIGKQGEACSSMTHLTFFTIKLLWLQS